MGKLENLMPPEELNARLTPEQRRANASKAGKASGKAKAERKKFKDLLIYALSQPNADNPEVDNWTAATAALLQKALGGDIKAWETMRDTIGQKPVDEIRAEVSQDINIIIEE